MKIMMKFAVIGLFAVLFMLGSTATASAATGTKNINVSFKNVMIIRDYSENPDRDYFQCKDVNGNEVIPFIYEGTTFVPIRTVADMMHKDVDWDSSTNTITITTPQPMRKWVEEEQKDTAPFSTEDREFPSSTKISATYRDIRIVIDGKELAPTDANGKIVEPFIYNGATFIPLRAVTEAFGSEVVYYDYTNDEEHPSKYYVEIRIIVPGKSDSGLRDEMFNYVYATYGEYSWEDQQLDGMFKDRPVFGEIKVDRRMFTADNLTVTSYEGRLGLSFKVGDDYIDEFIQYTHSPVVAARIQGMIDDVAERYGENAAMHVMADHSISEYTYVELWYPSFMNKEREVSFDGRND